MVTERGLRGVALADVVARAGVAPPAVTATLAAIEREHGIVAIGDRVVAEAALTAAGDAVLAMVGAFHTQHPLSEGLPREEARARVSTGAEAAIFERVVRRLVQAKRLVDRDRLALPAFRATVPGGEATVAAVEAAYREAGLTPPDVATVAARLSLPPAGVEAATTYLLRQKRLARLDTLVVHQAALESLKQDMAALKAAGAGEVVRVDVAQFKDRYGITRKFAIPLLEYLDRERVTRRAGDARVLI
jgi:selenocysteine-specific elongation factor